MKRTLLALLAAWLLGIATALAGMGLTGGWYEYRFCSLAMVSIEKDQPSRPHRALLEEIVSNSGGWQPVSGKPDDEEMWVRRPRIRLGW